MQGILRNLKDWYQFTEAQPILGDDIKSSIVLVLKHLLLCLGNDESGQRTHTEKFMK